MTVHDPIARPDLTALRIRGMMPFTGDDAIPLVEQVHSLLLVLEAGFKVGDVEGGPLNLRGEIVGTALEGVASLVALARFAIDPQEFAEGVG